MSKRKKKIGGKPSNAYLISFGDTMTAMLAFFIVLNTLAQEQTGANLHSGTGSFVAAVRGLGLPGWHENQTSKLSVQMTASAPAYFVNENESDDITGEGPDPDDNQLRSINREDEQAGRLLHELEQIHDLNRKHLETNQITFDLFSYFDPEDSLPNDLRKVLGQSIPLLFRDQYNVTLVVWSTTPAPSAIERATIKASKLRNKVVQEYGLPASRQANLDSVSKLWFSSDDRRPTISVVVTNVTEKTAE